MFKGCCDLCITNPVTAAAGRSSCIHAAQGVGSVKCKTTKACFVLPNLRTGLSCRGTCHLPAVRRVFKSRSLRVKSVDVGPRDDSGLGFGLDCGEAFNERSMCVRNKIVCQGAGSCVRHGVTSLDNNGCTTGCVGCNGMLAGKCAISTHCNFNG